MVSEDKLRHCFNRLYDIGYPNAFVEYSKSTQAILIWIQKDRTSLYIPFVFKNCKTIIKKAF